MSSEAPSHTKEDLVPLCREIHFDDTMREFKQVGRLDIIDGKPLRAQLLLDRRHKLDMTKSKPVGFFRMSQTEQLTSLAVDALAAANVLALRADPNATIVRIEQATASLLESVRHDVVVVTNVAIRDIKEHRKERAG